jgi:hypothetical protein
MVTPNQTRTSSRRSSENPTNSPHAPQLRRERLVKVFGRRPSRTFPHARRPASENLQGTKAREGAGVGRCRGLSYGDLVAGGPQLRSAARLGERGATALQFRCNAFSAVRAGAWLKVAAAVA